ncbi:hypothetical protein TKK_0004663 [Trichogramma kaykai]
MGPRRCDAEQITSRILQSVEGIPLSNIVAFCSDTCNVMMGSNKSVSTKLKEAIPHIIIIKCNCHIENLCVRHAMKCIPSKYSNLVTNIYNYINANSPG